MGEAEWLIFPIKNESGFKVKDMDTYNHVIKTVVEAQIELQEEYPGAKILVVYETGQE